MGLMVRLGILILFLFPLHALAGLSSVAFFYGAKPPLQQLRAYDAVVVSPDSDADPAAFNTPESELFAYTSIGEVDESASYRKQISPQWIIGSNAIWKAKVVDQTQPGWQTFFVNKIITPLWEKGYRGFFLDTLDSYQLAVHDKPGQEKQVAGLVQLIHAIKTKYPNAKLILNRGFELLPQVRDAVYAVAAESLFAGWNQKTHTYQPVSAQDRAYLLSELSKVQQLDIPVIVIEYLPPERHQEAERVAQKIMALKMIPWVTDGALQTMGVGSVQSLQRNIFIFYTRNDTSTLFDPSAFVLLDLPLSYLGYTAEYHDADAPLPENFSPADYAGIIVWANPKTVNQKANLHAWLVKRLAQNVPIVFIGGFGFMPTPQSLAPFGLDTTTPSGTAPTQLRITQKDPDMMGFEIAVYPNRYEFMPLRAKNSRVFLQMMDEKNRVEDAVAITPWGGYALDSYVVTQMPKDANFWVINPFKWLQSALRLPVIPAPDMTTENGRRLMLVHIDGDGFVSRAEWKGGNFAAVELLKNILKVYQIPTSVSVITGDIAPNGLHPKLSSLLINIARDIFALPWVEIASHTFSHPFDWIMVEKFPQAGRYNLPIPNYRFNAWTDIGGSVEYINKNLAPPGKTTKMLFWSGYANPNEQELATAFRAKVGNLNGGDVYIIDTLTSISAVGPVALARGKYVQVYAPMDNEEYYTNGWNGPFYGFERVIQSYKLTESPRRLKPIDIYYHFYSATKLASMVALRKIYDWTLSQSVLNIFASEYFAIVLDARNASIARVGDGWRVRTSGVVRELRVPIALGYPDLERSENLVGFQRYNDSYYLHLGPASQALIYFKNTPSLRPYLVEANGRVTAFQRLATGINLHLQGYLPLQFTLGNMLNCETKQKDKILPAVKRAENTWAYQLSTKDSDDLRIICR